MASIEGICVLPDGKVEGRRIEFESRITSLGASDADQCIIFPGFVDVHVHAREDRTKKWNHKEDFATAGQAAVNGGVTAFMDMPNTPEPTITEEQVESRRGLSKKSAVPVVIAAGVDKESAPMRGVGNYKVFMTKSVGDLHLSDAESFEHQLSRYTDAQLHIHCEDHQTVESNPARPAVAEHIAVERTIGVIRRYNLRAHICHVSTERAAEMIRQAKQEGLRITAEVTPHHLFFDIDNVGDYERASFIKMNPPLRTKEDRLALIEALRDGTIDALASDHAPHTLEEKESSNPSGVPHLDTFGPFACWLMAEHNFTPQRIAECCARFPARLLGLDQGEIAIGRDASFTLIDMRAPLTITKEMLKTKCGWSPFEGITFPGRVVGTVVRGKIFNI